MTPLVDRPELPATWRTRRPFQSQGLSVFAHDEHEAEAAAAIAAEVAAAFRRRTSRAASQRILVITGSRDVLVDGELCHRVRLAERGAAILDDRPEPNEAELARRCDEVGEESVKLGLDPQILIALRPEAFWAEDFVADLGLPRATGSAFDWAIVMATDDELDAAVGASIDAAVAQEELNLAQRMVLAPLLPWMRGKAVEAARGALKETLYAAHAAAQRDWTAEQRRREVDGYERELGLELDNGPRRAPAVRAESPRATASR